MEKDNDGEKGRRWRGIEGKRDVDKWIRMIGEGT